MAKASRTHVDGRGPARGSTPEKQTLGRRPWLLFGSCVLAAAILAVVLLALRPDDTDGADVSIPGVRTYEVPSRQHVTTTVEYPQSPPVGGDHFPAWQNCGIYDEPIASENGVHSLEHGAVWISYRPDLDEAAVSAIRGMAEGQTYLLVSPYEGLASPIVLTSWGRQLSVSSIDDPSVERFIEAYRQGPDTPELGAICTNGVGSPS